MAWPKKAFAGKMIPCLCGAEFYATLGQIERGRKKYCSQACKYKFKKRPSGLTYKLSVVNPTWFTHGERPSRSFVPPKGTHFAPQNEFKKGHLPANFKGDAVGYGALHGWVHRRRVKINVCIHCKRTDRPTEWANISWEYRRDVDDWMELCKSCHSRYDRNGGWGAATAKFGLRA